MSQALVFELEEREHDYTDLNRAFIPLPLSQMGEAAKKEYWAVLALRHCPGIGGRTLAGLLKRYGSAFAACEDARSWNLRRAQHNCSEEFINGSWRPGAKQEWDAAWKTDANILLWQSSAYPDSLRELVDAPGLLYCQGDPSLVNGPCVAIVGTRNPTRDSARIAFKFAQGLSKCGITVVSGMALGIDREAHAGALNGIGKSIGVLGTGINTDYPKSNLGLFREMRKNGLLISEFSPNTPPIANNFPIRNRIISGLVLSVVVVEAAIRSGSLITARLALEQNREVMAVPGAALTPNSMGCQNLVRQGATPVFCVDDILRELAPMLKAFNIDPDQANCDAADSGSNELLNTENIERQWNDHLEPPLQPPELKNSPIDQQTYEVTQNLLSGSDADKIMASLQAHGALDTDSLVEITGLSQGELSAALLGLEMGGQIRRLPGARYEIA